MDLENLLQPVSEDNPVGADLRDSTSPSSSYNVLKDARNQARAAERNNVFDANDNTALSYWKKIFDLTPEVLCKEAKDLEITSWYIESMVRINGFDGLLNGLRILHGLITEYWDDLYPLPDEEGIETKVAAITGLNGEGAEGVLITPIRNIPITLSQGGKDFSLWQYQQALDVMKLTDENAKAERINAIGFSIEDINQASTETSVDDIVHLKSTINACLDEYRQISQQLDELCGEKSPPSSNIVNVLEDCIAAVKHLYKDRQADSLEEQDQTAETDGATGKSANKKSRVGSPIRNREEAFEHILEISAFFRRTEPHSPVSYVLEKAVKWGRMPLDQLIPELIADGGALEQYRNLTGIITNED